MAHEIFYFDLETNKRAVGGPAIFQDEHWATWSCVFGWPMIGIWPVGSNGSDINTVDCTKDRSIIAVGDNYGKIKLFKYPSIIECTIT